MAVREVLSEASTAADGVLSRERSAFCRSGSATLRFIPHMAFYTEIKAPGVIFRDKVGGVRCVGIVAARTGEFMPLS